MNQNEIKIGFLILTNQNDVVRAWSSFGTISAATHNGTFHFRSIAAICEWASLKN
jgi:hypothetical protein